MEDSVKKRKFDFGEEFEAVVIKGLIEQDKRFQNWLDKLDPGYFNNSKLGYLFDQIIKSKKEFGIIPNSKVLKDIIRKEVSSDTERKLYFKKITSISKSPPKPSEFSYVLKRLGDFCKTSAYMTALPEALVALETGNPDRVDSILKPIMNLGIEDTGNGLSYFKNLNQRIFLSTDHNIRYKFLIPELDSHLRHGGMTKGETVVWMAVTGAGKTMALIHTAKAWAVQRLKGVFYTFQLSEYDIAERLDSSFTGTPLHELLENPRTTKTKMQKFGNKYGDSLIIKYFTRYKHSFSSIKRHIGQLREEGFNPDYIVVDYLNLLRSENQVRKDMAGSRYYEGGDVAGEFIALCKDENLLGAAGAQANRTASSEELTQIKHFGESFAAAQEATLVVTINRSAEEREENRARLYLAKYSHGKDQLCIPINTNYERGSLYKRM